MKKIKRIKKGIGLTNIKTKQSKKEGMNSRNKHRGKKEGKEMSEERRKRKMLAEGR